MRDSDTIRKHHDRLVCERCGRVAEFVDPDIRRLQDEIARAHGFQLVWRHHELFGRCPDCRAAAPAAPRALRSPGH